MTARLALVVRYGSSSQLFDPKALTAHDVVGFYSRTSERKRARKLGIAPVLMARPVLLYPPPPTLYSLL